MHETIKTEAYALEVPVRGQIVLRPNSELREHLPKGNELQSIQGQIKITD
jgi:hypothetical protein